MIELKTSKVIFNEEAHSYTDESGKQYSGITSLIHSVLRLGVYPEADERAKQIYIPRAGYYGTCVHKAIQTYDTIGIELTEFPEVEHATRDYGVQIFPSHDVSAELAAYLEMRGKSEVVASEFTVSYGDYASQIDSVWQDGDEVILVDFKTNNLEAYPGGVEGLKQYLSWQLSCYAFMFWKQTGIKPGAVKGMHIRDGKAELWDIELQPMEQVQALLETECVMSDNGFVYFNPELQVEEVKPVVATSSELAVPAEITQAIVNLLQAEKVAKEMKARLEALMRENGIVKWECDDFVATISKDSTRTDLDKTLLKKEQPEIYEQYCKTTKVKGAFKIKAL